MAELTRELIETNLRESRHNAVVMLGTPAGAAFDRQARMAELALRALDHEADLALAAGELLVPIPEPGTDMARLLSANVLMRREIERIRAALLTAARIDADGYVAVYPSKACEAITLALGGRVDG